MKYIILLFSMFFPLAMFAHDGTLQETIKCGTFLPQETHQKLNQVYNFGFNMRSIMDQTYSSPSGKFLIHYDLEGLHAVDPTDNNSNGIPDYVDSVAFYADFVYQKEVEELGYYSPLPEPGGKTDQYDIYLYELGETVRYYGLTQSDGYLPTEPGDNGYRKFYSFMVIDNDFSITDSTADVQNGDTVKLRTYHTFGYDALKITLAHEFHHAIQYVYGNITYGTLFAEMTSTFMEYRFFPEIKDYYQYVNRLFKSLYAYPFGVDNANAGYAYSIFAQYLDKKFGDKLLRRSWELADEINDRQISYVEALDLALAEEGTDFETIWADFQPYIYFTGSRAQEDKYLADAAELPEIKFYQDLDFFKGASYSSGELRPLEQRGIRFKLKYLSSSSDTLDIMITNFDKKRYPRHSEKQWNYNLQCSSTEFEGATNEQNKDVFWKKEDPGEICHFIPYLHKGDKVVFLDFAFPNPYIPKQHAKLLIPVPEITDLYKNINVVVFSSNMHEVFSETLPFEVMDDSRIVIDISNKAKDLSSGVYLYKISTEENDFFGKFVVKDTE